MLTNILIIIWKGTLVLMSNGSPSFRYSFAEGAQAAASIGFLWQGLMIL